MLNVLAGSTKPPFEQSAAEAMKTPIPDMSNLRCMRAQHDQCGDVDCVVKVTEHVPLKLGENAHTLV
jgi:hypothetical protein